MTEAHDSLERTPYVDCPFCWVDGGSKGTLTYCPLCDSSRRVPELLAVEFALLEIPQIGPSMTISRTNKLARQLVALRKAY